MRLDKVLQRDLGSLVPEEAVEEEAVVGRVDAECVLHDLGDVAQLVAYQAVAILGDGLPCADLLGLEGGFDVERWVLSVGGGMSVRLIRVLRRISAISSSSDALMVLESIRRVGMKGYEHFFFVSVRGIVRRLAVGKAVNDNAHIQRCRGSVWLRLSTISCAWSYRWKHLTWSHAVYKPKRFPGGTESFHDSSGLTEPESEREPAATGTKLMSRPERAW